MAVNPQAGPVVKYSQLAIICNPQRNLPSRLSPPQPLLYQPTPGDSGERAGAVTHMVPPWYGRGTTMAPPWYPPGTTMPPPCLRYETEASVTNPSRPAPSRSHARITSALELSATYYLYKAFNKYNNPYPLGSSLLKLAQVGT